MVQTYGERLKALREARGLTQEQLAQKSGMDVYVIKWVESGILDPGMGRTARLADALGVNPTYLAGFTPPAAVAQERAAASPANARSLHQKAMDVLEKQLALLEKDNLLQSETEAACRTIDAVVSVLFFLSNSQGEAIGVEEVGA